MKIIKVFASCKLIAYVEIDDNADHYHALQLVREKINKKASATQPYCAAFDGEIKSDIPMLKLQ